MPARQKGAGGTFLVQDCKMREHFGNQQKRCAFQHRCETRTPCGLSAEVLLPLPTSEQVLACSDFLYSAKDNLGVSLLYQAVAGFKKVCNSLYFFENQQFFVFCI